jgi:hypothetical protein
MCLNFPNGNFVCQQELARPASKVLSGSQTPDSWARIAWHGLLSGFRKFASKSQNCAACAAPGHIANEKRRGQRRASSSIRSAQLT